MFCFYLVTLYRHSIKEDLAVKISSFKEPSIDFIEFESVKESRRIQSLDLLKYLVGFSLSLCRDCSWIVRNYLNFLVFAVKMETNKVFSFFWPLLLPFWCLLHGVMTFGSILIRECFEFLFVFCLIDHEQSLSLRIPPLVQQLILIAVLGKVMV